MIPSTPIVFATYEELEDYLKNWSSFAGPHVYDPSGMIQLFCACIANMQKNMSEEEVQEFGSGLTDNEKAFLRTMASAEE